MIVRQMLAVECRCLQAVDWRIEGAHLMAKGTVAVIGAGPYGLSVGAHLLSTGIATRVFGETMSFWRQHMPAGMLLRSEWDGSSIAGPGKSWSLDEFESEKGVTLSRRLPLEDFIAYGGWFQRQAVPEVDPRHVKQVTPSLKGFRLELEDGEALQVDRVVVATGLASFAVRPDVFSSLPPTLALHSSDVVDPSQFAGERTVIVGGGQSALELGAILNEAGAEIEMLVRAPEIRWLMGRVRRYTGPFRKLLFPPAEVGPLGINWVVQYPDIYRRLPDGRQKQFTRRALKPAGSGWLRPRMNNVTFTTGRNVVSAEHMDNLIRLVLDDQSEREIDRVVLATGYRVDVDRYPFLSTDLARAVRRTGGLPLLNDGFESSVPGLHFVGTAATESFGPLIRFVNGTGYTARAVTQCVLESAPAKASVQALVENVAD
jgi:Pyridine nucleotide-disulphide oxidoreductase